MLERYFSQLAIAQFVLEFFTYADGAAPANLLTKQAATYTGSNTIASNQLVIPANGRLALTNPVASQDILVVAKCVSKTGEGVFAHQTTGTDAWEVDSPATGLTALYYNNIAGSTRTKIREVAGGAANDMIGLAIHGNEVLVYRNGVIIMSTVDNRAASGTVAGVFAGASGGTIDSLLMLPVKPFSQAA